MRWIAYASGTERVSVNAMPHTVQGIFDTLNTKKRAFQVNLVDQKHQL